MTITTVTQETMLETRCVHLLHLSQDEEITVESLMQLIIESDVISDSAREELLVFQKQYDSLRDPNNEEKSVFLYYLIEHILISSIENGLEEDIDELLEFESKSRELLTSLLPEGVGPDSYLEHLGQEEIIVERLVVIENFFNSQMELLESLASTTQKQMIKKFSQIKEQLIQLSSEIEDSQITLINRIAELSLKVESAGDNLQDLTEKCMDEQNEFTNLQMTTKQDHRTFKK